MSDTVALPSEIQFTSGFGGDAVYVFPRRDLGKLRWLSLVPIAFGLFIWAFVGIWSWGFIGAFVKGVGPWGYLVGLIILPFVLGGGAAILLGMSVLWGHGEIRVSNGVIRYGERIGLLPWMKTVRREQIVRLVVHGPNQPSTNAASGAFGRLMEMGALAADVGRKKPRWLATCYPRSWLLAVADHLSAAESLETSTSEPHPLIGVIDATQFAPGEMDRIDQPAGSSIVRQEIPGGFTLIVPALGVWKGSAGLFTFSLIWCGFMTLFTAGVGYAFLQDKGPDKEAVLIFASVITLFWCAGAGMLLGAINMGRRQAAIAVTNNELKLIQSSLLGVTRKEWFLTELHTARKGPSGMEVNNVPVMQLQIVPQTGSHYGLLTGRDEAELEWLATQLRQVIGPSTISSPDGVDGNA